MKKTPNKLRSFRLLNGYTEKQVAAYLGIKNPETIAKWENGETMPSTKNAFALGTLYKALLHQMFPIQYKEALKKVNERLQELKRLKKIHGKDWKKAIKSSSVFR